MNAGSAPMLSMPPTEPQPRWYSFEHLNQVATREKNILDAILMIAPKNYPSEPHTQHTHTHTTRHTTHRARHTTH